MITIEPVIIGDCTLYHGLFEDIAASLPKVDLVACDAAYELESGGNTTGVMNGKFSKDRYDNSGKIVDVTLDWPELMALVSDTIDRGHVYIMANNRNIREAMNAGLEAGLKFHNLLVWDKGTATPNRWYMKNCEFIAFLYKGLAKPINNCGDKQLIRCPNVLNAPHPNQKPTSLMEYFIRNSSVPGDVILDPQMGSGTTGVACAQIGRKFIGIEKEKNYFDLACERIELAYKNPSLFKEDAA